MVQVALQWAAALGGAPAARLLAARGLAALGARWALQAQRYRLLSDSLLFYMLNIFNIDLLDGIKNGFFKYWPDFNN